jgi:cytochrome c oxidase assembly factor CtaG
MIEAYEAMMGLIGIAIATLWLCLIWLSVRSGSTWGWPSGPRRSERPVLFWLSMAVYFALAVGFAAYGLSRV